MNDEITRSSHSTFRLRRRTPGSFVLVPCPQLGRSLRCQGQLEAAAAVTLAACPEVANVQEQPTRIWYAWCENSKGLAIHLLDHRPTKRIRKNSAYHFSYVVPDFLVEMIDGARRLVEVKPSADLDRAKVQRKLAVAGMFAAQQKWTFHVVTEQELFDGPLVSNLRLLCRYRSLDSDESLTDQLVHSVVPSGLTVDELIRRVSLTDPASVRRHVFHLLAVGRLGLDPTEMPLNDTTLVFPEGTITWDPFASLWGQNGFSMGAPSASSANSPQIVLSRKTTSSA